jgi:VWFA-related protein
MGRAIVSLALMTNGLPKRGRLLSFLLLATAALVAQDLPPSATVQRSVNLVQTPVIVEDAYGHLVTDLKSEDFEIRDNGKLQSIARFQYVVMAQPQTPPPEHSAKAPASDDVAVIETPVSSAVTHVLIVIPQLQWTSRQYALRAIAKALHQHLLDDMSVAIVDNSSLELPFTTDRGSLEQAVQRLLAVKLSPCNPGPWFPASLERMAQMQGMPGRKFLLYFSDVRLDPQCPPAWDLYTGASPWPLVGKALNSGISIYPVDARGVVPVVPLGDASTDMPLPGSFMGAVDMISGGLSGAMSVEAYQRSDLLMVAAQTGGRSPAGNDLQQGFREIRQDSSYYALGYYLPDLQADGSYHRLQVTLKRPGLRVLARTGYYAPFPFGEMSRSQKREWLYQALLGNQPLGDIQIAARSSAFFNPPAPDVTVPTVVHAHWWVPAQKATRRRWMMTVGIVQNGQGEIVSRFDNTNFWHVETQARPQAGYVPEEATYNLLLQLKPGQYVLKLALADLDAAIVGSYQTAFRVSDHTPQLPAVSSLVFADKWLPAQSTRSDENRGGDPQGEVNYLKWGTGIDPLGVGELRLAPSTAHIFTKDSQFVLFARFYPASDDGFPESWTISAVVRNSAGKVVAEAPISNVSRPVDGVPGVPVACTIDLSKYALREGSYSAELEFKTAGRKQPVQAVGHFAIQAQGPGKAQ